MTQVSFLLSNLRARSVPLMYRSHLRVTLAAVYRKFAVSFSILFYHLLIRLALSLNLDTSIIIYGEAREKAKGGEGKVSVTL